MVSIDAAFLLYRRSGLVSVSLCCGRELCKNGRTDRDASGICGVDSCISYRGP